ncbi:MAG: helix-turn-helix transcriptional regulator [Candidatus Nanoarchaeia archaeon]
MKEITFDLLKLHSPEDRSDPKKLIIARGGDLPKTLKNLINRLNKKHSNFEITNKIAAKEHIPLRIKNSEFNLGIFLEQERIESKLTKETLAINLKISGGDLNKLLQGKHIPSCKKLQRIANLFPKLRTYLSLNCNNPDFCLQKIDLIQTTLTNPSKNIPLFVIKELLAIDPPSNKIEQISVKDDILKQIEYLKCNQIASEEIRCCHTLNESLAKIVGSFCADGSLGPTHDLRWEEEHHSNMIVLAGWLKECFTNVEVKPASRGRNSYVIRFRSKIISRYLTSFFKLKPSYKTHTVRMPSIFRQSDAIIKKAFLIGALTFEAGANNNHSVNLGVVSKKFRDDLARILKQDRASIHLSSGKSKNHTSTFYTISTNNLHSPTTPLSEYFEPNTFKWLKMKEFEEGFSCCVSSRQEAIAILSMFCYKNRNINIPEIFYKCESLSSFDVYDLIRETGHPRPTLQNYLSLLEKTNILTSIRRKRRAYTFNSNVDTWRLPSLQYHHTLKT